MSTKLDDEMNKLITVCVTLISEANELLDNKSKVAVTSSKRSSVEETTSYVCLSEVLDVSLLQYPINNNYCLLYTS